MCSPHSLEHVLHRAFHSRELLTGAPGFWIGNVIGMAGVPSIMQAMLDEVAPKLSGVRMLFGNRARGCARGPCAPGTIERHQR